MNKSFYIDSLISPNFWKKKFTSTFGILTFWLEKVGVYFALFMFISSLMGIISVVIRTYEMRRLTANSLSIGSVLFSGIFNVLHISSLSNYLTST